MAHRAQRIWELEYGNFGALEKESHAIFEQFQSRKGRRLPELLSDRSGALELWKFYSHFKPFMTSYSARAFPHLERSSHDAQKVPKPFPSLSL